MRSGFKFWAALAVGLCLPVTAMGENWLLVETRKVPNSCEHPLICVAKSKLDSRHLLNLSRKNRQSFMDFLKNVASISGIPDSAVAGLYPVDPEALHAISVAPKLKPLADHPGVYFESTKLDDDPITGEFSGQIRTRLEELGLKMLTKAEWQDTPGKPTLSIRFTARLESAGCIVPFAVYMTIKEEVILVRDPTQKIEATVWSTSRRQNLAHTNYTPQNAVTELLDKFEKDWRKANRAS